MSEKNEVAAVQNEVTAISQIHLVGSYKKMEIKGDQLIIPFAFDLSAALPHLEAMAGQQDMTVDVTLAARQTELDLDGDEDEE